MPAHSDQHHTGRSTEPASLSDYTVSLAISPRTLLDAQQERLRGGGSAHGATSGLQHVVVLRQARRCAGLDKLVRHQVLVASREREREKESDPQRARTNRPPWDFSFWSICPCCSLLSFNLCSFICVSGIDYSTIPWQSCSQFRRGRSRVSKKLAQPGSKLAGACSLVRPGSAPGLRM